jgi:hypothetical protein
MELHLEFFFVPVKLFRAWSACNASHCMHEHYGNAFAFLWFLGYYSFLEQNNKEMIIFSAVRDFTAHHI